MRRVVRDGLHLHEELHRQLLPAQVEWHLSAVDLQSGKAGSSKRSRSDGECLTLDCVKHSLLGRRGTLVGDAAVVEDGADEGTVDKQEGVSRGPPMRARHGTHQVETLPAAVGHVLDVLGPREMTVENDSQKLDAALVEQARGPQLQRQMGWPSPVAAEIHGDGLGCGHLESPLVKELLEPVEVGLEVSPVGVWVGPSSPDGAVIRVEGELDAVLWLRDVVHHDDEQHRADDAALRRSVLHKEQIGKLRSDAHTYVSVGEEVPDPVEHVHKWLVVSG